MTDEYRRDTRLLPAGLECSQFQETSEAMFLNSGYVYDSAEEAAAADADNDKIDIITGAAGANSTAIDVKSAIAGGGGSETVTASVTNGVVTLSGSDAGLINTLSEWIDAVSVDGVIKKAADDADAVGAVAFQLNGNTYLVESNDTSNNNAANVSIVNVIELTGLTGVNAVADAAAANTILIA